MKDNTKVYVREIKEFFGYSQISGDEKSLERWTIVQDLNRPGLELSGYEELSEPRRIVIIGNKEKEYIEQMPEDLQRERFKLITDAYTPMILIARNLECPKILKEIADENNFPIFVTDVSTYRVMVDLITYLDEKLAEVDSLHGVLMSIYGIGVLITGESGVGKSEIALELIKRGHVLIADDRVDVKKIHNSLIGYPAELLKGMLEIRGIGIIDVSKMFGASSLLDKFNVDFNIQLEKFDDNVEYTRVGNEETKYTNILDINIPAIKLPVNAGRSMAIIVESAVTNFRLKQKGIDSAREFEQRVYEFIKKSNLE